MGTAFVIVLGMRKKRKSFAENWDSKWVLPVGIMGDTTLALDHTIVLITTLATVTRQDCATAALIGIIVVAIPQQSLAAVHEINPDSRCRPVRPTEV